MSRPVIFFDQDNVLANFTLAALAFHKKSLPPMEINWDFCSQIGFTGITDPLFWDPMGREFWASIPVCRDGRQLLVYAEQMVSHTQIGILTSPSYTDGGIDGKRDWVRKHIPHLEGNFFTGKSKGLIAGPGKILLDDYDKNIDAWKEAGGMGILVPRSWNTRRNECFSDGTFDEGSLRLELSLAVISFDREDE